MTDVSAPPEGFVRRHADLRKYCHPAVRIGARQDPTDPADVLAMQMVLHIPKADPPQRASVLSAAATAALLVCLDESSEQWRGPLLDWMGSRIRKVSRRARGAQWSAAAAVEGLTASHGGAEVHACVPCRVGDVDTRIKKLQISGTDIPADVNEDVDAQLPVLWVNSSLGMTVGKAAAQVGHASMLFGAALNTEQAWLWACHGFACTVREADKATWAELMAEKPVVVRDAGFTEIAPGSATVIATWH
ncbi:peptidyl-tRNA hydrolase [Hoyosella rhizosphaerae]|uniref:peptidyl-tRNA hydrolase n=1 Tax=Hoyosella rhizosphaerae TaxID=1755582 RepID=A0A916UD01_9ACTN|nr:peptidyl-tRNA hydrolase [Hoyosella rhizosphaerae]MBN4925865.1 peptidyl-tRNA hydrolase [Hoyosella rhizosphaerae]GGC67345.1 hypothetical protein GCM10011410_20040 [Hoyosella rhizosphaerae]